MPGSTPGIQLTPGISRGGFSSGFLPEWYADHHGTSESGEGLGPVLQLAEFGR